jgi:sortase A
MYVNSGIVKKSLPFKWSSLLFLAIIGITTWQFTQGKEVYLKAWLSRALLHTAWVRTQASGRIVKPWPWANTWPLGRIYVPRLNMEQIILFNNSNNILSLAISHANSTVLPGYMGNSVINIHRNIYVSFLKHLKPNDKIVLESLNNGRWHYTVANIYKVDRTTIEFIKPTLDRRLTLISCYPCKSTDERWRYVVVAKETERVAF